MNYNFSEISYPSSDSVHTVHAEIYFPKDVTPVGVVMIAHGMVDYVERYIPLAEFLCAKGYVVAGNDHLGHGKTVNDASEFGFFAKKGGVDFVLADLYEMNKTLRANYPGLPVFLLGHSMGSFIARLYAERHPHSISGLIIHGTAGPNPVLPLGKALAALVEFFRGSYYRSKFIKKLANGGYNKRFPKEEGDNAWLTRKCEAVANKDKDARGVFSFTISGYRDLFRMLGASNSKKWFKNYPKSLPTLIVSGDADPVGSYGKGPSCVYKRLMISGAERLDLKLYPGARHELFNETNADEVFRDLYTWLESVK